MSLRRVLGPAVSGILVLCLLAGCGDDDDASSTPAGGQATSTTAPAGGGAAEPEDLPGASGEDDPNNPWVLGYRVTGPAGSQIEVDVVAVAAGEEQPSFSQRPEVGDEPWTAVFTNWVESATLEITSIAGGPVTVEGITGRFTDADDPFGGIDVSEVHGSVEVGAGETVTLEVP
jgi:hypothetical protein